MKTIKEYHRNKRGIATIFMFLYVFIVFFLALFLGIAVYGFGLVNDVFDRDLDIGQVNLRDINDDSFGKMHQAFVDTADTIGLVLVLGMSFIMIANAYLLGDRYPKLFFVVDVLILVFVFILSVYLQQTFSIIINVGPLADYYAEIAQ